MKFKETIESRLSARHKMSLELVTDVKGKKILDIGCYNGWFERYVLKKKPKYVAGIDPNPEFIRMAKANVDADFILASSDKLPFKRNYFDIVVMFDVLEHIPQEKVEKTFDEIKRVLKKDGYLLLSTPYNCFLTNILDPAYWMKGHRHYNETHMKEILDKSKFKIEKFYYGGGIVELTFMILLYLFKLLRLEVPFKSSFERYRDKEYNTKENKGFATIFVKAVK